MTSCSSDLKAKVDQADTVEYTARLEKYIVFLPVHRPVFVGNTWQQGKIVRVARGEKDK